jgi:UDP-N-acetylmuramoyl-tripeptide--D-alanyl-D-alanine ligase
MRDRTPQWIADAAGAELVAAPSGGDGPSRVVIDSRSVGPGDLFVGLPGEHVDGGTFAEAALTAGAWGVLVAPEHAAAARDAQPQANGTILATEDPLHALQLLATAWRRELAAVVIGVTGSTGKTSTKDILAAMLAAGGRRVVASSQNLNT